jgi:hypothetical protein
LFSNFCVYQPGKAELLRGMLEWLNHRSPWDRRGARWALQLPLAGLGGGLLAWGIWTGRRQPARWVLLVAAGYGGWTIAALAVIGLHRSALPVPPVQRPLPHVVIDRTVSEVPLHTGAFADDQEGLGYGLLEQWIPRLGNRISRATGAEVWSGDGLVIVCPTRSVSDEYQRRLIDFVAAGGRLLVIDSPDVPGSTANSLLRPFGLASTAAEATRNEGTLRLSAAPAAPGIPIQASCRIDGGEPIAHVNQTPVAAQIRQGRGLVTALGFGSLFNDAAMGFHWLPEPEPELRERYEFLYAVLRAALPCRPPDPSPP